MPENEPYYQYNDEGSDDVFAHVKASMLGLSLMAAITHGTLNMGFWLGTYLCEHRIYGGARQLLHTLQGK